ncbi:MAG TPA: SRPBCC family protein [Candidatus Acidoferrales bacterium]|nr:SRPBCC family protein [Candidatus Acidoferrales bacterium]
MANGEKHVVSASARIPAPPVRVYGIIANYVDEHPRILPPEFSDLAVEQGGTGAGTIIRFKMRVLGRTQNYRALVMEPEPGRVLVEKYLEPDGTVTTFTVDPEADGAQSRVTFATAMLVKSGFAGKIERFVSTRVLRPIFIRELQLLSARATQTNANR